VERENFVENLLTFMPLMHKKFMKELPACGISKQQIELLFRLNKEDGKLMSYYSEKMMIPKPNLTLIVDKLIEEGLIVRVFDPNDRRVVILKITDKGREYLYEFKERVKQQMVEKLDIFSNTDIKRLNELIKEMKVIFEKMEL
jgi:MarR family transcriptional regulator, organic hydroperoxide resistance regulator